MNTSLKLLGSMALAMTLLFSFFAFAETTSAATGSTAGYTQLFDWQVDAANPRFTVAPTSGAYTVQNEGPGDVQIYMLTSAGTVGATGFLPAGQTVSTGSSFPGGSMIIARASALGASGKYSN